jgi:putative acetyltransferase
LDAAAMKNDVPASSSKRPAPPDLHIAPVCSSEAFAALAALFREYQAHINVDLCFQGFDAELADLPKLYAPPHGAAFIAYALQPPADSMSLPVVQSSSELARQAQSPGVAVGCVALKLVEPGVCEMKRLYVQPAFQAAGMGRMLATAVIARARELGYARMRLDTLATMRAAQALYRTLGFVDIAPYNDNPHAQTRFMELKLS